MGASKVVRIDKELSKKTGLKLAAIVVIGGVIMFSFTACGKNQEVEPTMSTTIETVTEVEEEPGVVAGGLYNEDSELGTGSDEKEVEEEYTVSFENASNEKITAKDGETVVIPEYQRQRVKDMISVVFDTFNPEDTENYTILEETENDDGSTTYLVSLSNEDITNGCTTQYSVDENGEAKAIFVYQPNTTAAPKDFGINFVLKVDEEGNVSLEKILDLNGNDATDITFYKGNVIGWGMEENVITPDFEFGDELNISQDLTLYPVYDEAEEIEDTGYYVNDGKLVDREEAAKKEAETKTNTSNSSVAGSATQEVPTQPETQQPITINPNQSTDEIGRALFGDAYKGSGVGGDSHATGLGNKCE